MFHIEPERDQMKYLHLVIYVVLVLLVSCSSPEEKAQKELSARGVPVLVSSYMDQAKKGNNENIQLLLTAGIQVDSVDEDGNSAIHLAAESGQTGVIDTLLSAGADKNLKDKNGNTPLIRAVMAGKKEAAVKLVTAGANSRAVNTMGRSVLSIALGK